MKKILVTMLSICSLTVVASEQEIPLPVAVAAHCADGALHGYVMHKFFQKYGRGQNPRLRIATIAATTVGITGYQLLCAYAQQDPQKEFHKKIKSALSNSTDIITTKITLAAIPATVISIPTFLWVPAAAIGGFARTATIVWTEMAPMIFRGTYFGMSCLLNSIGI